MKRLLFKSMALAGSLVALAALAPAADATHVIDVGENATLVAKGAGVLVPVEVTCEPASGVPFPGGSLTVSVTQRVGNRIAQGSGAASPVCDGTAHSLDVLVFVGSTPGASASPFRNGPALASASMFVCDFAGCHDARDTQVVDISR